MKKVIILQHNGGQLANQLWNFVQIYAYCLEKKYACENWSFFEYHKFFDIPVKNPIIYFLFFKIFNFYSLFLPFRIARKIGRVFYGFFVELVKIFGKKSYINAGHFGPIFYLPPTKESEGKLKELEEDEKIKIIFMEGWILRNPVGTEKYQKEIINFLKVRQKYREKIDKKIQELRQKYKHLVGVHIRQRAPGDGDFKEVDSQKVYIHKENLPLVYKTFKEYLNFFKMDAKEVVFVFCSNKEVDLSQFKDLNCYFSGGNAVEDLYLLSQTDIIFGCKSTFSAFASYYGQKPLIIFNENGIEWKEKMNDKVVKYLK